MKGLGGTTKARVPIAILALLVGLLPSVSTAAVIPPATPRAKCRPGSIPETGAQGRVTAAVYATGMGLHCNVKMLGHAGTLAGYRTYRYVDPGGRECAYYDSTPYIATRSTDALLNADAMGVHVLDMSDPSNPIHTEDLRTPAMRIPHESLSLHAGRGLLAAAMGNPVTGPGFVDVYDVSVDCRHPTLLSSLPVGILGHEGSFSPDGMTYWVSHPSGGWASARAGGLTAIDVSDPTVPRILWTSTEYVAHGFNLSEDGNTLYYADFGPDRGLTILDVHEVQLRAPIPTVATISHLTWDTVSLPQTNIPVTIGGRQYLVEIDEFTRDTVSNFFTNQFTRPEDLVGAARIIDIADPAHPIVVSDIRLEVNQPSARQGAQASDPGANSALAYTGHYCAVPRTEEPGIVACSFILSGLRVFDIRDPLQPKEIAYFNPPTTTGAIYAAMSAPTFAPERNEIWYTDANYGFYSLKLTNGVWPQGAAQ